MKNEVFEEFRNKHLGERVFLIANGPSLSKTDLDLLKDETTIAMNRISLIYDKNPEWRPTYYLFSSTNVKNPVWGNAWQSSVREAIGNARTTSFVARIFKPWVDPTNLYPDVRWFDSMSETKPAIDGSISKACFSTDVVDVIDKSGTTMNLALQLSYYMGFKEIIFVGADLGWKEDRGSESDCNHFDPSYRADIANPNKANNQMRNVHSLAARKFRERDQETKFYNATADTVLDVYPIIDFESFVNDNEVNMLDEKLKKAIEFWEQPPQFGYWKAS